MDTKELGDWGEGIACEYLVEKGYKILAKNWRIKFGEIDIICRKKWKWWGRNDKTIHFVEVKTIIRNPSSPAGSSWQANFFPEDRVDYKKRKKLRRLTEIWLAKNGFTPNCPHQIDVIGIMACNVGEELEIRHFENVVEDRFWFNWLCVIDLIHRD